MTAISRAGVARRWRLAHRISAIARYPGAIDIRDPILYNLAAVTICRCLLKLQFLKTEIPKWLSVFPLRFHFILSILLFYSRFLLCVCFWISKVTANTSPIVLCVFFSISFEFLIFTLGHKKTRKGRKKTQSPFIKSKTTIVSLQCSLKRKNYALTLDLFSKRMREISRSHLEAWWKRRRDWKVEMNRNMIKHNCAKNNCTHSRHHTF